MTPELFAVSPSLSDRELEIYQRQSSILERAHSYIAPFVVKMKNTTDHVVTHLRPLVEERIKASAELDDEQKEALMPVGDICFRARRSAIDVQ